MNTLAHGSGQTVYLASLDTSAMLDQRLPARQETSLATEYVLMENNHHAR